MSAPYPGFPPSFAIVETVGGLKRQCWVLELCTDDGLDPARQAQLEDAVAMLIDNKFPEVKHTQVARSNRFDTDLRKAMRLE